VVEILSIAAHRDDVEQTCGGTLLKMAALGHRTAILDLTRGEMGTRGTAADREREAGEAARILRVSWRGALNIPDGRVENTWENRLKVAAVIRALRPRAVILPYWQGRHPDHYTCSTLGYEACFLAGLTKLDLSPVPAESLATTFSPAGNWKLETGNSPHRPFKIVYATLYYDIRPTFVVDITHHFEARLEALMAYQSQYTDQQAGSGLFPRHAGGRHLRRAVPAKGGWVGGGHQRDPGGIAVTVAVYVTLDSLEFVIPSAARNPGIA
jgi:bacillithiol biosynthesis deacetylase BshB1